MAVFSMSLCGVCHSMVPAVLLVSIKQRVLCFCWETSTILHFFPQRKRNCLFVSEIIRTEVGTNLSRGWEERNMPKANRNVLHHKAMSTECQNTDKYTKCSVGSNSKPFVGMMCAN